MASPETVPAAPAGVRSSLIRWPLPGPRWMWLWLLGLVGGVVLFLLQPGNVTDDSWAFLVWGRDLDHFRHLALEGRAFQPTPILAGAVLALFGSAAPTATLIFSLGMLVILGAGAWRVVELLHIPQPAPVVAAALAITLMPEPYVADVAYNNGPFATVMIWALVLVLEERRRGAWLLLIIAGLTRPEAWVFLCVFAVLDWWRLGRPMSPAKLLQLLALAIGPIVVWVLLELGLTGDALYSAHSASGQAVANTGSGRIRGIITTIKLQSPRALLIFGVVGGVSALVLPPRVRSVIVVATTALTLLGLVILGQTKFNVPGRDYSLFSAEIAILATLGAALPARLLARYGRSRVEVFIAGAAVAAVMLVISAEHTLARTGPTTRVTLEAVSFGRTVEQTFIPQVGSVAHLIDAHDAPAHSVAMIGMVNSPGLAWALGLPYDVIKSQIEPQTKVIVQPAEKTWKELNGWGIDNRTRVARPKGWQTLLNTRRWQVFAAPGPRPIRLQ